LSDLLQSVVGLAIPVSIMVIGFSIRHLFGDKNSQKMFVIFESFVAGMAVTIVTLLIAGMLDVLSITEIALTAISFALLIFWLYRLALSHVTLVHLFEKINGLKAIAWGAFTIYVGRLFIELATRPIHDGDALYDYLSMGKVLSVQNGFPLFDFYHFWKYTNQPGVSILNSWSFTLGGSINSELFRVIPVLAFALLPLLVFLICKEVFEGETIAYVAMIMSLFIPAVDSMLYFYGFYPDMFALIFSGLAFLFIRRVSTGQRKTGVYAGLCIGLTLLFKYTIGLFTVAFSLVLLSQKIYPNKVIKYLLVTIFAVFFIIGGQSQYGILSNPWTIFTIGICLFFLLLSLRAFSDIKKSLSFPNLLVIAFFASICLIWGVRSLVIGSSMFDLPFLRLTPIPVTTLMTFSYSSASTFGPLSFLTPVLHPWFNLFFFPISLITIIYLSIKNSAKELTFMFFFYLLFYLTLLGNFLSGRHLLLEILFLVPMLAYVFVKVGQKTGKSLTYFLLLFFCATAMLQWVTLYFGIDLSGFGGVLNHFGLLTYSGSYTNDFSINFLIQNIGIYLFLIIAAVFAVLWKKSSVKLLLSRIKKPKMSNKPLRVIKLAIIFFTLCAVAVAQFGPYLINSTIGGSIFTFDYRGSYNRQDMDVAQSVKQIVPSNSVVVTYGDVLLSYNLVRVMDLYRGSLNYFSAMQNGSLNINILIQNNFTYCLFPGSRHYLYSNFCNLVSSSRILTDLNESKCLVPIMNYGDNIWILYKLVPPDQYMLPSITNSTTIASLNSPAS
jgi:hypothetical protein